MSAFMCSPETLYVISDYLFSLKTLIELKSSGIIKEDPLSVDRSDLFGMLYQLNKKALQERYGDRADELINYNISDGFKRARAKLGEKEELIPDKLLFYKLECFLYQCAEDNVCKSPLYRYLSDQQSKLAAYIVRESEEYKNISIDEWN